MPYFDSAATSKPNQKVLDIYNKASSDYWYNSSSQYRLGVTGQNLINKATNQILELLNVNNKKVIYTSGATEANNTAIFGICEKYIGQNKHIITSSVEHSSVLNCFKKLEKLGFEVTYLPVNKEGTIDIIDLENAIKPNTIFISIMWVNNIVGSIMPIKKIIEIVKKHPRIKLHVDTVQGITKIKNDFDFNDIDLFTISAHKINGLKGIGALILNKTLEISPLINGGHQQNSLRAGTIDLAGILGFVVALKESFNIQTSSYEYVSNLYEYLVDNLKDVNFIILNKNKTFYSPYILSITFKNIKAETVMHYLENFNIYVGIGSACNEKTKVVEPILESIHNKNLALNTIRVSLSKENTKEEIDLLISKIKELGEN